MVCPPVSDCSL